MTAAEADIKSLFDKHDRADREGRVRCESLTADFRKELRQLDEKHTARSGALAKRLGEIKTEQAVWATKWSIIMAIAAAIGSAIVPIGLAIWDALQK